VENRRICPNCRAFISNADRVCPYCEFQLAPPVQSKPRRTIQMDSGGMFSSGRFVTMIILMINFGLYAATAIYSMKGNSGDILNIDVMTLRMFGAKWPLAQFQAGQWWRLVTAGFLHGGVIHILFNSWALFDVGALVEQICGVRRYIVIYFVSTVCGYLASTYWSPVVSIGASAGIFGLIGAMIAIGTKSRTPMGDALRSHFMQWAVFALVMSFVISGVDNAAHIGGLASGFGVAWVAGTPRAVESPVERIWGMGAIFCLILTVASFALMFLNFASMSVPQA
jgi:rhomboid protease GluP